MRDQIGAGAVEALLEQGAEEKAAAEGKDGEDGGADAAGQQQKGQHAAAQEEERAGAAQCGEVARRLLQPARAERVVEVGGIAQSEQQPLVEGSEGAVQQGGGKVGEDQGAAGQA